MGYGRRGYKILFTVLYLKEVGILRSISTRNKIILKFHTEQRKRRKGDNSFD